MGIIQRQALKNSVAGFIGTGIAAISTLFIYPLDMDSYGLAQYLIMAASLFSAFASFGTPAVVVKFFPAVSDGGVDRSSYLFNILLLSTASFLLFIAIATIFKTPIYSFLDKLQFDVPLIRRYAVPIIGLTYLVMTSALMTQHASNYRRIVVPEIFQSLVPKLVLPALILMMYATWIGEELFVHLWLACYLLIFLFLVIYLWHLGALDLKPRLVLFRKTMLRRILSFASFNGLSIMGNVLANRIDLVMVATLLGTDAAGYYAIALFIANIIYIPTKAVWSISAPLIAGAWERKDLDLINEIYQKAAINLLVIGFFLFFFLYGSLDGIFSFSSRSEELVLTIPIFFWLGIAKLVDMGSSVNVQVIMYSGKYKYNLLFTLIVGTVNTVLNYTLIQQMGVVGAALATALSVFSVNFLRMLFIGFQFRLLPFSQESYKVVILGLVACVIWYIFPQIGQPVLHLIAYSISLTGIYLVFLLVLRVSPEMVGLALENIRKFTPFQK